MKKVLILVFSIALPLAQVLAQVITRYTYHDAQKKNIKEAYQVKDTINNVLHGRYISYFLNSRIESKGQFVNNETTGIWEFYYETGRLKMRGVGEHSQKTEHSKAKASTAMAKRMERGNSFTKLVEFHHRVNMRMMSRLGYGLTILKQEK